MQSARKFKLIKKLVCKLHILNRSSIFANFLRNKTFSCLNLRASELFGLFVCFQKFCTHGMDKIAHFFAVKSWSQTHSQLGKKTQQQQQYNVQKYGKEQLNIFKRLMCPHLKSHFALFGVDTPVFHRNIKKKIREEERASGISPEVSELYVLLEDIIQKEEMPEEQTEK